MEGFLLCAFLRPGITLACRRPERASYWPLLGPGR